jgi:hypothetical protein
MASFRQEDKIKEVGAVNPIITQPVADTSTAEAITAAANTGIQIYGKVQQQRGKELAKQAEDELAAGVAYDQAGRYQSVGEQEAIALGADQGRALALGRGALTPTQFRARAEAKLKQAMAANPFFSDQIAQGFASVSGYDPRGSMTAALEEQLRMAQSARDYDPAKKAKEETANLAYTLGITYEQARVMRAQQVGLQYQVEMAQNQDLSNKRNQMSLQSSTIAQGTQNFLGVVNTALAKGPLTPQEITQLKNDWAMHVENQRETLRNINAEQGQKWLGETDYDEQMTRQTTFITNLLDNNDATQVLTKNKEYALAVQEAALLSDANLVNFISFKNLAGEQVASMVFDAMGNKTYANFVEDHPIYKGYEATKIHALTISGFAKITEGKPLTKEEQDLVTTAVKSDPRIVARLPNDMAEKLIGTEPTSINTMAGEGYATKVRTKEITLPEMAAQMNRMAQSQILQYPVLSGKNKILTGLEVVGTGGGRGGGASTYKLVDQDGEPVPDEIYSVYNAIKRVATRYPEITEGMSIQEFAIKTMLGEQQKEKPKPAPAPKPEPVPESLTENTQDKAAEFLAEFKRKYPSDAGQFTDEEILGFFNSGSGVA